MTQSRFAIYFTAPPASALARFGAGVLGYDCDRGEGVELLGLSGIPSEEHAAAAIEPQRYGFHATLKAPFSLRTGTSPERFDRAIQEFAARTPAVALGRLRLARIGAFLTLRTADEPAALKAFAAECVTAFDDFRAPLSAADRERRLKSPLTPHQIELLDRWGYPYVLDQFRFHMTLAGPLPPDRIAVWTDALGAAFAPLAAQAVTLDAVSLVRQDNRAGAFRVISRHPLFG